MCVSLYTKAKTIYEKGYNIIDIDRRLKTMGGRGSGSGIGGSSNIMDNITKDYMDSYTTGVKMHYGLYKNLSSYEIGQANLPSGRDISIEAMDSNGIKHVVSDTSGYNKKDKTITVHTTPEYAKAVYMRYTLSKTKKGTPEYANMKKKYDAVLTAYNQYYQITGKGLKNYHNSRNKLQSNINSTIAGGQPNTAANKKYINENKTKINKLLTSSQASKIKKTYYDSKKRINSLVGNVDFTKYK